MIVGDLKGAGRESQGRVPAVAGEFAVQLSSGEVPSATYQSFEQTPVVARQAWPTRVLPCAAMVFVCVVAFLTYAVAEKTSVQTFLAPALQAARAPTAIPRNSSRKSSSWTPPS